MIVKCRILKILNNTNFAHLRINCSTLCRCLLHGCTFLKICPLSGCEKTTVFGDKIIYIHVAGIRADERDDF